MLQIRKKVLSALAVLLLFALTACGNTAKPSASSGPSPASSSQVPAGSVSGNAASGSAASGSAASAGAAKASKILVVYFSATGTTKGVAEKLAQVTGADLTEIVPAEPYTKADLDYNNNKSRTSVEMNDPNARPQIAGNAVPLDGYSTIFLGYPIWWGAAPRILSTFVESQNFGGKTVIPFCTSGGSDIGASGDTLAKQAGSGNWLAGKRFDGSVPAADLTDWVRKLGVG